MADETPIDTDDATPVVPTGSSAAAILLMLLGEEEAATVLSRLNPDEVQLLGGAMFNVANISENEIDGVFDVFCDRARVRTTLGFGVERQIKGMMHKALGQDKADQVLQRITPVQHTTALENLKWMDARQIANLIEFEHPQIAAIVLAFLEAQRAADVLQLLPEDVQADLVYRVATMGPVTEAALEELDDLLSRPATSQSSGSTTRRGGAGEAAKIVNSSRKAAEQRIIKALQKLDKTVARTIEEEMFIFDNLNALTEKDLGALLRAVDNDILVVSLKGADEKLRAKIFGCMSSRAAQSVQDEIADRGPMRLADVQEAQKAMLAIARKMAAEGSISLGGKGDDFV
ncbi:flagellar motor switch protein FliG [Sphingomonadaceae bacterium G21617-S1]|jgi:flagellar motor switch protein FliG|uniref:flagellar motor switch protein FliG n=1 Tax=Rhizorhabdus sp. TaxID=1968843 RepID=UPI00122B9117|nr:flagellar motor switch protein FliG [Rhizorhabdus sp.]MBD3762779.1 flagellar motor switch protein FliG [Rhizorhabdus sp.]MCZ4342737.1 flagellar motor switch protein FliG [Sphingomonadaceae bacterium G21617-S1]TAK07760.1 MAG: flagellar motor switch protein FliG [Rhizorhabdus sp.]